MRLIKGWMPLLAAMLMAPAALAAQPGGAQRGWMGVALDWDSTGAREARVAEVVARSAAERAGLRTGDVVVRVNGAPATERTIERLREELEVGDTVRLRIRRGRAEEERRVIAAARRETIARTRTLPGEVTIIDDDNRVTLHVDSLRMHLDSLGRRMGKLRERVHTRRGDSVVVYSFDRPDGRRGDSVVVNLRSMDRMGRALGRELGREYEVARTLPFFLDVGRRAVAGAELSELNPELARYFRVDDGVLVLQVSRSTPAARAGLQGGDVIVRAGGRTVGSVADLRRAFGTQEGSVRVEVVRQGQRRQLDVEWRGDRVEIERTERVRIRGQNERSRN
ncbi:MAG TPA: PDZ domain-containing protein [Longimicrobium sp.]|jgi:C-terminal processing protease CtpA/Prc